MFRKIFAYVSSMAVLGACQQNGNKGAAISGNALKPVVVTEKVAHDSDDPAIWINRADTLKSLVLGTDKDSDGALYAFDLDGRVVNRVRGLKRPNNVDVAYDFMLNGKRVDIAVLTERETNRIRVFTLPNLVAADGGGIEVFAGEAERAPMGIALYTRAADSAVFAIVGRKSGPADGYLWQYRLQDAGQGLVKATLVRRFGRYSGKKEIESIAVDNRLGYVYCSDETVGVRKYFADPDRQDNRELALFATAGFASDHEGISVYPLSDTTGYLLVSNQQANTFMVYRREGAAGNPHRHELLCEVPVSATESDGSDVTAAPLGPRFPKGLFVAMSNGQVFQYYSWEDIAGRIKD